MKATAIVLVVVGSFFAVSGVLMTTGATNGVGAIALACFLAILARIAQAEYHKSR